jgi:Peptidase family M23
MRLVGAIAMGLFALGLIGRASAGPGMGSYVVKLDGPVEQGSVIRGTAAPGAKVTLDHQSLLVDPQGRFVFGFDRDATGTHDLAIVWPNGQVEDKQLTVAKREWQIQSITGLPQKEVMPPPEAYAQIKREITQKLAARSHDTQGSWFAEDFIWPAHGPISGVFGSQRIDNGTPMAPHFGVDMAAPTGTPIHAPATGIVTICDHYYLDGGFTLIDHGMGVSTCYLHQSKLLVKVGQKVTRGERIGLIGQTGRATGPHLHWAMNWFEVKLDPSLSTRKPKPDPL